MQAIGLLSLASVLWLLGRWPVFEAGMVPFAVALGALGVVSVAALYRGLAIGPVAVVAPVVASYVVITVILVVIFLGERLTIAQILAASVVFVGVVLTSTDARELRVTLGRPAPGVRIGPIGSPQALRMVKTAEEIAARTVLSTANPARTLLEWVDPVWLDPDFLLAVRNIRHRGCTAIVLYALEKLPEIPGLASTDALAGTVSLTPTIVALEKAADAAGWSLPAKSFAGMPLRCGLSP